MTGKGDRWGRDTVGRSAPTFLAASTTALPPSTCTARRKTGRHRLRLLFRCEAGQLLAVCCEACAGWRVRRLCCLQRPGSAGCACLPCLLCHVNPLPFSSFFPRSVHFALLPIHSMCARIIGLSTHHRRQHVCKLQDCPVGSCNTGLQWRPVRRVHLTFPASFPAESMILGHGLV